MIQKLPRLLLGNHAGWTEFICRNFAHLQCRFDIHPQRLSADLLDWADIVVPLDFEDYKLLRNHPAGRSKALYPSANLVQLCHDKIAFREWIKQNFGAQYIPATSYRTPWMIAKPRFGRWGNRTVLVKNDDRVKLAEIHADPSMYLEDYIEGEIDYAYHLLVDTCNLLYAAATIYTHDRSLYVRGVDYDPAGYIGTTKQVPTIFYDILRRLNYSGTVCIDYKIDANGQIKIFEMNPRVGGSLIGVFPDYLNSYATYILSRLSLHKVS